MPKNDIADIMQRAKQAAAIFHQYDQEQTDAIVKAVFEAGFNNRIELARMAAEETKLGVWEHKVLKNVVATQFVYNDIKNLKTVGVISEDEQTGIVEIAQPLGPIFAIIPVTNPTSTTLFKILIALKTRNPIIIRPHSSARKCSIEAARICYEAAMSVDAPEDCIQWMEGTSRDETKEIMSHPDLALILATGGGGLVNAAYSSGTPAIGVGAGNVPVFIEQTADFDFAVEAIMSSKLFDNGTVCASEQAIVVEETHAEIIADAFRHAGACFLNPDEVEKVSKVAVNTLTGIMNPDIIGQPVAVIAERAGIEIPEGTKLLIAPLPGVGKAYPLSSEVLAPVIAWYRVADREAAINRCIELNYHGGVGHTASIYSNDEAVIREFALLMNAGRIVVNTPSSQGAVGGLFNTLQASLTLGCGTGGKNITTDNISARHLMNIQRIARRRINEKWTSFDKTLYYDEDCDAETICALYNRNH